MSDEERSSHALDQVVPFMQIPEGAVPESGIIIVSYLGEDGVPWYSTRALGHGEVSDLVGTMTMVIYDLLRARHEDVDE